MFPLAPWFATNPHRPQPAMGGAPGQTTGLWTFILRVVVKALAEEERVTGAVGDVLQTNATADEEDAVPLSRGRSGRPPVWTDRFPALPP